MKFLKNSSNSNDKSKFSTKTLVILSILITGMCLVSCGKNTQLQLKEETERNSLSNTSNLSIKTEQTQNSETDTTNKKADGKADGNNDNKTEAETHKNTEVKLKTDEYGQYNLSDYYTQEEIENLEKESINIASKAEIEGVEEAKQQEIEYYKIVNNSANSLGLTDEEIKEYYLTYYTEEAYENYLASLNN